MAEVEKMRGKLRRRTTCRVPGHGSGCEVSREQGSRPLTRRQERALWASMYVGGDPKAAQ